MKQYKITFYYNRKTQHPCSYYREFETVKELKEDNRLLVDALKGICTTVESLCTMYKEDL